MIALVFDCSSSMSIALIKNNTILQEKFFEHQAKHSELLILEINKILIQHGYDFKDLDLVLVTNGPGSYTGLRVSLSALKMLKIGLKISCLTINSCAVIAQKYINQHPHIKVAIQGNVGEIYFAEYQRKNNTVQELIRPLITDVDEVYKNLKNDDFLCGSANNLFTNHSLKSNSLDLILARDIWILGEKNLNYVGVNQINFNEDILFDQIAPLYLRDPKISVRK